MKYQVYITSKGKTENIQRSREGQLSVFSVVLIRRFFECVICLAPKGLVVREKT